MQEQELKDKKTDGRVNQSDAEQEDIIVLDSHQTKTELFGSKEGGGFSNSINSYVEIIKQKSQNEQDDSGEQMDQLSGPMRWGERT